MSLQYGYTTYISAHASSENSLVWVGGCCGSPKSIENELLLVMTGVMWLSGTRTIQWQELPLVMCSQTVFVGLLDVGFLQRVEQAIWITITKSSL